MRLLPDESRHPRRLSAGPLAPLALACLLALSSATANAAFSHAGRWFQVEVVIFAYDGHDALLTEKLPDHGPLQEPTRVQYLHSRKGTPETGVPDLVRDAFIRLPSSMRTLNIPKKRLADRGDYRVLYHAAWRQPIFKHINSIPIYVRGGNNLGDRRELEGLLKISVDVYLAVEADLRLSIPRSAQAPVPAVAEPAADWHTRAYEAETVYPELNQAGPFGTVQPSRFHTIALQEKRGRIRSSEVHYFDHPRLGMLVTFTRYEAPPVPPPGDPGSEFDLETRGLDD